MPLASNKNDPSLLTWTTALPSLKESANLSCSHLESEINQLQKSVNFVKTTGQKEKASYV
jgi:hypothetical protein